MNVGELIVGDVASAMDIGIGTKQLFIVLCAGSYLGRPADKMCWFLRDCRRQWLWGGLEVDLIVRAK